MSWNLMVEIGRDGYIKQGEMLYEASNTNKQEAKP